MADKFRELDILLANFERGGTKRKEASVEVLTAEQKWSLDIQRVVAELKSGILQKKAPDDVDASALMNEVKDVLLLVRQLVQVLSASSSSLSKEMIARVSPCAAEVGITAKRLHRCLNAGSISLAALGLPPSSVNEDLIHNSLSSNGSTATSSNATVRFRGARKIFVAALDALLDVLPPLPSSFSTPSSSSPASSCSTSPRHTSTRPTSSFHPPTAAAALHSAVGHDQSSATPRAGGGPPPTVPPDVWQELSQGRKLSNNPRRASLHLALNKRTAVTPGVNDYRRSVAIDTSPRSQTPPASAFRSPRANLTVPKSPRAAPASPTLTQSGLMPPAVGTIAGLKSPRPLSSRDEEMLELLEQLDSELLTSFNSKEKRATGDHHSGDAAGHRQEDETEVLIQILEDLRLLVQGQVDATINNRAVAFSSSASTLRSLSSAFSDTMTVLKLEIATVKPDGPGESLMRSPPVAERMHDMLVSHHRLFVQTVLAGLGPEPQLTELLSPFPSRIDLVSFPLERLWRSPPVLSMQEGDSFHSLVSSAQQALDRLLARGQQQPNPEGLIIVKLDDLFLFKSDSRQVVSDLKCLHALLLRLSAAETDATTKRARATQAATLDFAVIVFIRCAVDLIAATCAAPSGGGGGARQRASAERWTAATMTLRKTLRTLALLHAMLGSS